MEYIISLYQTEKLNNETELGDIDEVCELCDHCDHCDYCDCDGFGDW